MKHRIAEINERLLAALSELVDQADLGEVDLEPSEQAVLEEARAAVAEARAAKGGVL